MKKLVAVVVLIALMISLLGVSHAESIDLSAFSDDEIVELMSRIQDELIKRHIPKTANLSKGSYLVGREIPAGTYIYTCLREDDRWNGLISVYTDSTKQTEVLSASVPKDKTTIIYLEEGNILYSDENFSLTITGGIVFQ